MVKIVKAAIWCGRCRHYSLVVVLPDFHNCKLPLFIMEVRQQTHLNGYTLLSVSYGTLINASVCVCLCAISPIEKVLVLMKDKNEVHLE